jgi:glycosyltransferase involved in cell wall biosynthesis
MKLVVIIPALNEEATVGEVIRAMPDPWGKIDRVETIVIDDGSTDNTVQVARDAGSTVVSHKSWRGLGVAFRTGLQAALNAGADFLVNIDADGQFDPADIPRLVDPLMQEQADFVTASRFADPELTPQMPRIKLMGNRWMSSLISKLTRRHFHDVSCGFRAYTRDTALRLSLLGEFTYTQEVFLNLAFHGARIMEVPLKVQGVRKFGQSRVAKSVFRYGINTARIIFRTYRDYKPMKFFGWIALVLLLAGIGFASFLLVHYVRVGQLFPHRWAGFVGAFLIASAFACLIIALLADMLDRQRIILEELLYLMRRQSYITGEKRDADT